MKFVAAFVATVVLSASSMAQTADEFFKQAMAEFELKEYPDAIELFDKAIEKDRKKTDLLPQAGRGQTEYGQMKKAHISKSATPRWPLPLSPRSGS